MIYDKPLRSGTDEFLRELISMETEDADDTQDTYVVACVRSLLPPPAPSPAQLPRAAVSEKAAAPVPYHARAAQLLHRYDCDDFAELHE